MDNTNKEWIIQWWDSYRDMYINETCPDNLLTFGEMQEALRLIASENPGEYFRGHNWLNTERQGGNYNNGVWRRQSNDNAIYYFTRFYIALLTVLIKQYIILTIFTKKQYL